MIKFKWAHIEGNPHNNTLLAVLQRFIHLRLPWDVTQKVFNIVEKINNQKTLMNVEIGKLHSEFFAPKEPPPVPGEKPEFREGKTKEAFDKEYDEMMTREFKVRVSKIPMDAFKKIELTVAELMALREHLLSDGDQIILPDEPEEETKVVQAVPLKATDAPQVQA